jgi:hypothetical protein
VGFVSPEDTAKAGAAMRLAATLKARITFFIVCAPFDEHSAPFLLGRANQSGPAPLNVGHRRVIGRHEVIATAHRGVRWRKISDNPLLTIRTITPPFSAHAMCGMA